MKKKSVYIGQGEYAPDEMWILFDESNGNPGSRRYVWYFTTRAAAREHKKHQNATYTNAQLAGPVRYGRR